LVEAACRRVVFAHFERYFGATTRAGTLVDGGEEGATDAAAAKSR
jgi:hypothetical protein